MQEKFKALAYFVLMIGLVAVLLALGMHDPPTPDHDLIAIPRDSKNLRTRRRAQG